MRSVKVDQIGKIAGRRKKKILTALFMRPCKSSVEHTGYRVKV